MLVIVLPALVVLGVLLPLAHERWRRAPFPPAGRTRAGLILHAGPPPWWEPGDAPRPRLWLAVPGAHPVRGARAVFTPGIATPRVRGASMCDACEAVVLDPRA